MPLCCLRCNYDVPVKPGTTAEGLEFKAGALVQKMHLWAFVWLLIMCGADSLSNWFAVVYMSIKALYSEAFERYIVPMLHVMNAQ